MNGALLLLTLAWKTARFEECCLSEGACKLKLGFPQVRGHPERCIWGMFIHLGVRMQEKWSTNIRNNLIEDDSLPCKRNMHAEQCTSFYLLNYNFVCMLITNVANACDELRTQHLIHKHGSRACIVTSHFTWRPQPPAVALYTAQH